MALDYTQTKTAKANRTKKANTLALAASECGYLVYELSVIGSTVADESRREKVRKHAGVEARPSDETWDLALQVLEANARALPQTVLCGLCAHPVRRVTTGAGAKVDLDVYAHPAGNVWPKDVGGKIVAQFLAGHDSHPDDVPLFRTHSRSCPKTKAAHKRRLAEAPQCRACGLGLSGRQAYRDPGYDTHPTCYEEEVIPNARRP